VDDVPEVVEAAAVRASGVVRGSGAVTKGIVPLKGVPCDDLKGGALETSGVGLEHPLDEGVEVVGM
jgi:hypothetical protein